MNIVTKALKRIIVHRCVLISLLLKFVPLTDKFAILVADIFTNPIIGIPLKLLTLLEGKHCHFVRT